jgi:hypothetical protein
VSLPSALRPGQTAAPFSARTTPRRHWIGRDKSRPEYAQAPHYHDAVQQWFKRLSPDDAERVHTVVYVYSVPGYGGEKAAVVYAALLPSVPAAPEVVRKAWLG